MATTTTPEPAVPLASEPASVPTPATEAATVSDVTDKLAQLSTEFQSAATATAAAAESAPETPVATGAAPTTTAEAAPATEDKTSVPAAGEASIAEKAKETPATDAAAPTENAADVTVAGWGTLKGTHKLLVFHKRLPAILAAADHSQIWGVTLDGTTPTFATLLILQKYLRSVSDDVDAAANALEKTLKWRKEFGLDGAKPIWEEEFGAEFNGLGYVTALKSGEVVTWNLYGAVSDLGETFGNLDKFLRWRIALMERAMSQLDLAHTTVGIPDFGAGADPHRLAQVHVYTGVSFLRLDPRVKAASKAAIEIMAAHYPETLARKLFVGVPLVMSWVFTAVRMFISAETAKKFVVVSYESNTAGELGDTENVPVRFGGKGPELVELDSAATTQKEAK